MKVRHVLSLLEVGQENLARMVDDALAFAAALTPGLCLTIVTPEGYAPSSAGLRAPAVRLRIDPRAPHNTMSALF